MNKKFKIGFCGYGNMAKAIVLGMISSKNYDKASIAICDTYAGACDDANAFGLNVLSTVELLASSCDIIFLAVKPQQAKEVLLSIKNANTCNVTIVSIMAGVSIKAIKDVVGEVKVVRCMPNMPLLIGMGVTGVCFDDSISCDDKRIIENVFSSIGSVVLLAEENISKLTAISGSGPAYVYYFINSLVEAGCKLGLSCEMSKELAVKTFLGASKMVELSSDKIEDLISKVCSKGGTTIEAINTFKSEELDKIVEKGVNKCYDRAEELTKEFEGVKNERS